MKLHLRFLAIAILCTASAFAQHTLTTENSSIEFSGYVTGWFNYRFYKSDETDKNKNRFALDYGVFRLDGVTKKRFDYQLQINFPALFDKDNADGFLMQGTAGWSNADESFQVEAGYNKVPFSRMSLVSNTETPFLQRPEIARGEVYNRRDAGVTVNVNLLNKRFNIIGGCYSGLGPASLAGDNDASGNYELVARVEYSWPARFRHREMDLVHVPRPMLSVGGGYRYADKQTVSTTSYALEVIDGIKESYSADFNLAWKGLSLHTEYLLFKMRYRDESKFLGKNTDYVQAGGLSSQLNYYFKSLKSILAVRYDYFNPNDLIKGDNADNISFAYNYLISGLDAVIKIHYFKRLKDSDAHEVWNEDQLRIALQLQF